MDNKYYNFSSRQFLTNGNYIPDPEVIGITFKNLGSTTAYVNGVPLLPPPGPGLAGESFSISANGRNEFFAGNININFATGSGQLLVIQQYYINKK